MYLYDFFSKHREPENYIRFDYIKYGIFIMLLAVALIFDRQYFFYPPFMMPVWNSVYIDGFGLISGFCLFLYGVIGRHNNAVVTIALSCSVLFVTFIISATAFHVVGIKYMIDNIPFILEILLDVSLIQVAVEREP